MMEAGGRLLLLGGGNMGTAMLGGWLEAGLPGSSVTVVDPRMGDALRPFVEERGVGYTPDVPDGPFDIVVLAVKPQMMGEALPALAAALSPETLAVSVAAGTSISTIEAALGARAVVRAMPNTPALIRRGITGAFANARCDTARRSSAEALLAASGPVEWVESEALIDAVTALSGSGPAYVFHLAEAMAAAGVELGLAPDVAMRLARHTVAGAGELMIRSPEAPDKLRRNVTSPNGTTQAALEILMGGDGLAPLMRTAMTAARDRATALSKD